MRYKKYILKVTQRSDKFSELVGCLDASCNAYGFGEDVCLILIVAKKSLLPVLFGCLAV
jgi:hypothetical protein